MAVVNQYKFKGIDNNTTGNALSPFGANLPGVNETIIIKLSLIHI